MSFLTIAGYGVATLIALRDSWTLTLVYEQSAAARDSDAETPCQPSSRTG